MKLPLNLSAALLLASAATLANPLSAAAAAPVGGPTADAPPPPDDGHGPRHWDDQAPGHWRGQGPRHHPGLPILRDLHGLNLSDAQRSSVKQVLEQNREAGKALRERRFQLMRGFATLDASAPNYAKQSDQLADEAAKLARETVRFEAGLTRQIVALLTPVQVQALQLRLQEQRQHPRHGEHERI